MSSRYRLVLLLFVCLSTVLLASPASAQFSGTWTGTFFYRLTSGCERSGPITIALSQGGSVVNGTVGVDFTSNTNCGAAATHQTATIANGTVASNILSGTLTSTFFGNIQYRATVSSNALFFTAPGAGSDDVFHAAAFLPSTSVATPVDLRGSWAGTIRQDVVYCSNTLLIDGTTQVLVDQSANTFAAIVTATLNNGTETCSLSPPEGPFSVAFSGTVDGSSFIGKTTDPDFIVPLAISGALNGTAIDFTISVGVEDYDEPNKYELLDSVFTAKVSRVVAGPAPSILSFIATPAAIIAGESATLSWTTQDATSASINQGINSVATSGSRSVSPTVTTTYTLTATGLTAPSATRTATVTVTPCTQPNIVLTALPLGMLQAVGGPLPTDSFTLTNAGTTPVLITTSKVGSFFTYTPSQFTIAPGTSQVISIVATTQPAGFYPGNVGVSACGINTNLFIPVYLRVAAIPVSAITATTSDARVELVSPTTISFLSFTNPGSTAIDGIVNSDVPWIVIPVPGTSVAPGESKSVQFRIDRALRPDADALTGGMTGTIFFRYVNAGSGSLALPGDTTAQTTAPGSAVISIVTVVVVDVVKTASIGETAPPLNGQLALFVAGATSRSSFGDLALSNRSTTVSIPDLKMFYGDVGGGPPLQSNAVGQLPTNGTFLFPSVLKNMFGQSERTGTLQLRSAQIGNVSVSQTQINSNFGKTYGTALPVFRSDRGFGPGETFFLPGVQKSGTMSTTIYLQEIAGAHSAVSMDLINAAGAITNGGSPKDLQGFGSVELADGVPAGIVTVRLTNISDPSTGGRVNGYALITDSATGDSFAIVQLTPSAGADPLFSPAFATSGSTVLHLTNSQSAGTINVSATAITAPPFPPRHRAAKGLSAGSPATQSTLTIPAIGPLASFQLTIAEKGFVKLTGSSALRVAGRISIPRNGGTFGTSIPVVPGSRALKLNDQVRFTGIEDSSATTVAFARPLTYSTDLMLVETTGAPVTVRLTLRYVFSGAKTASSSAATQQFDVPAGGFTLISNLGKSLIGSQRNSFGDLHNAVLDVEIIGGAGAVLPFLKSTDNGTGDISIRND